MVYDQISLEVTVRLSGDPGGDSSDSAMPESERVIERLYGEIRIPLPTHSIPNTSKIHPAPCPFAPRHDFLPADTRNRMRDLVTKSRNPQKSLAYLRSKFDNLLSQSVKIEEERPQRPNSSAPVPSPLPSAVADVGRIQLGKGSPMPVTKVVPQHLPSEDLGYASKIDQDSDRIVGRNFLLDRQCAVARDLVIKGKEIFSTDTTREQDQIRIPDSVIVFGVSGDRKYSVRGSERHVPESKERDRDFHEEISYSKSPGPSWQGSLIHPAIRRDLEGDRGPTYLRGLSAEEEAHNFCSHSFSQKENMDSGKKREIVEVKKQVAEAHSSAAENTMPEGGKAGASAFLKTKLKVLGKRPLSNDTLMLDSSPSFHVHINGGSDKRSRGIGGETQGEEIDGKEDVSNEEAASLGAASQLTGAEDRAGQEP